MSNCIICSEEYDTLIKLDCLHSFCKICIEKWKEIKMHCPLCRELIFPEKNKLDEIEKFWKEFFIHDRIIKFIVNILKEKQRIKENSYEYKKKKEIENIITEKIYQYYQDLDKEIQKLRYNYNLKFFFWNLFCEDSKKALEKEIYKLRYNLKKKYIKELEQHEISIDETEINKFKEDTYKIPIKSNNNDRFYQSITGKTSFTCCIIFTPFSVNPEIDYREIYENYNEIYEEDEEEQDEDEQDEEEQDENEQDEDEQDEDEQDEDEQDENEQDEDEQDENEQEQDEDEQDIIFFNKIDEYIKNYKEYSKKKFECEFKFIMKSIFQYDLFNTKNNKNFLIFLEKYKDIIYRIIEKNNMKFCKLVFNEYNELFKLHNRKECNYDEIFEKFELFI